MAILENAPKNFDVLLTEISTGQVKIPQFQRRFVWDKPTSAKLLDSMLKGYPIGTFIFWRTDEELRAVRNIGNIELPVQSSGEYVNYVLDGQQRITSIFAAIKGEKIERDENKIEDFREIFINLNASQDEDIIVTEVFESSPENYIRLTDLIEGSFALLANFPQKYHGAIKKYQNILKGYSFNVINLKHADIDVATEVFTRLNVGGRALSLFEIMVAKTYEASTEFDLSEKYEKLCQELVFANYEDIPTATVLQVVSMLLVKDVKRSTILKLDKKKFIEIWPFAVDCIKRAIDFFRGYGIVVSRLLPYPALIVPFAYYFFKNKNHPTGLYKKRLEDFFWRVSLGTRYSSGVESKLAQDVQKIDDILNNTLPKYEWSIDISPANLMKSTVGWFATGRSFVKAILCLYAIQKPKSFNSGQDVIIDNSYLKISTSKNFHHFFPKAYIKKHQTSIRPGQVNHVLNITIVDADLNKNKIKAKPPSVYMMQFSKENKNIVETMKTHLIGDFEKFGINHNDFEKFLLERAKNVSRELKKRLIDQETGAEEQVDEIFETDMNGVEFE